MTPLLAVVGFFWVDGLGGVPYFPPPPPTLGGFLVGLGTGLVGAVTYGLVPLALLVGALVFDSVGLGAGFGLGVP